MINIITIEREYGCGGGEIAQALANRLGWKLWDQRLTEEIARLANCPKAVVEQREEKNDPLYYRLFKSFLRGSYEGSINAPKLNLVDSETILKTTRRVVEHGAEKGNCVIVGRGSQHFLKARADTLRVFLYAPREDKVRRLLTRGKNEKEAQELVDTVDRERAAFIQKYFNVEWPDRGIYHSMVNTTIGDEAVVHMILDLKEIYQARAMARPLFRNLDVKSADESPTPQITGSSINAAMRSSPYSSGIWNRRTRLEPATSAEKLTRRSTSADGSSLFARRQNRTSHGLSPQRLHRSSMNQGTLDLLVLNEYQERKPLSLLGAK